MEWLIQNYTSFSSWFRFKLPTGSHCGKEWDDETGNFYYRARYYNPKISVWLSVDPLAHKYSALSSYNFVMNNPLVFIDPDGRKVEYHSFRDRLKTAWNRLSNSSFRANFNILKKSSETYVFKGTTKSKSKGNGFLSTDGTKIYVNYTFNGGDKDAGSGRSTSLLHETEHGVQFEHGEVGFQNTGTASAPNWVPIFYDMTDELKAFQAGSMANGTVAFDEFGQKTFQGEMSTIANGINNPSVLQQNINKVLSYYPKGRGKRYHDLVKNNNVMTRNSNVKNRIQDGKYFIRPYKKR